LRLVASYRMPEETADSTISPWCPWQDSNLQPADPKIHDE
jgi:hypothetical protein